MKKHFVLKDNPFTICGKHVQSQTHGSTNDWAMVTCLCCLKRKPLLCPEACLRKGDKVRIVKIPTRWGKKYGELLNIEAYVKHISKQRAVAVDIQDELRWLPEDCLEQVKDTDKGSSRLDDIMDSIRLCSDKNMVVPKEWLDELASLINC